MKNFKIFNMVTKILFSSEKTRKLINGGKGGGGRGGGVQVKARGRESRKFFRKKSSGRGVFYSGPTSI